VRHLRRFSPAPAVGTKCGGSAGHWSWSTRAHHAGAEAASLAACEATNRKVMVLVYKSLHRLAPPYLSDDCQLVTDVGCRHLRSADVHICLVPRTQSRLGDRSFGVTGPRLWNSLPVELWQQDICLTEFRRLLKTFLFR